MRQARKLSSCLLLVLLGATLLGCQRQAPGPDECARFAEAVVTDAYGGGGLDADNQVPLQIRVHIEQETQECLTRPYDRQLLQCVLATHQARACLNEFVRRTGRKT